MDSITHIVVGACVGEAFFRKGFGKKAMLWGALAQSIPDIDFIATIWLDVSGDLLAHRGFTHSIIFAVLVVPLFALAADRIHRPHDHLFRKWLLFFSAEVFLHLFLDGFNNYGVGWFEPFTHKRFSFNILYVADPLFSIWPFIACLALVRLQRFHPWRSFWWRFGLLLPLAYLGLSVFNKLAVDKEVNEIFVKQHIPHDQYMTTPTPLNNLLWYTVAGNDSGFYVGYRSVFDDSPQMHFEFFPRNEHMLDSIRDHPDLQRLLLFSQGFYTVEDRNDTLIFNDLRFGQVTGWHTPRGRFAFYYYLEYPEENDLIVQRGRFANWDKSVAWSLLNRICGH